MSKFPSDPAVAAKLPIFGSLDDNFAKANIIDVVYYSETTCNILPFFVQTEPYSSGYTYSNILLIVSAVTTVLTLIFTVSLVNVHLACWVKPKEQKQIVRVILFPTVFSFFNLYAVWFYERSWILLPFPELYECFALVAMFYFIVVLVTPDDGSREHYFHSFPRLHSHGKKKGTPKEGKGSLRWFRVHWIMVFQVLPVKVVTNLLEWILSAVECPLKYQLQRSTLAIEVIESVSTSICIYAVVAFAQRIGTGLKGNGVRGKLISFKGIVGISLTQGPLFAFLASYGGFHRTKYVSVFDFTIGTPAFMTCCEMFITSIIFLWTFSATNYLNLMQTMPRRRSVGGAFLEVLDIRDILKGLWYMTKIIFCCGQRMHPEHVEKGLRSDSEGIAMDKIAGQESPPE